MKVHTSRTELSALNRGAVLGTAELCHGIKDEEMELAAAWEYFRQLYRSNETLARFFDRLRKTNKRRNRFKLAPVLQPTPFFPNRYALTFLISPEWPEVPFKRLTPNQMRQAFPEAPIYQKPVNVPKVGSFMHPAEVLTPGGIWADNWSAKLLDIEFSGRPLPFRSNRRLLLIDTSYDSKQIKEKLETLLSQELPKRRTQGRNPYEAALKDLALLRAQEAGWHPDHFDELWEKAGIPHPKTGKTDQSTLKTLCGVIFEARGKRIGKARKRLEAIFQLLT